MKTQAITVELIANVRAFAKAMDEARESVGHLTLVLWQNQYRHLGFPPPLRPR